MKPFTYERVQTPGQAAAAVAAHPAPPLKLKAVAVAAVAATPTFVPPQEQPWKPAIASRYPGAIY